MHSPRAALRILAGLGSVAAGVVAAVLVIAATGGPDAAGMTVAVLLLLLGFAGLGVARTAQAPLRPMRLAVAISLLLGVYMIYGLPWPPRGTDLGSLFTLASGVTLSGAALLVGPSRPRLTCALLAVPAIYGGVMLINFGRYLVAARAAWGTVGPAVTIAYTLAASLGVAWVAALWHSRVLWGAFRDHLAPAT